MALGAEPLVVRPLLPPRARGPLQIAPPRAAGVWPRQVGRLSGTALRTVAMRPRATVPDPRLLPTASAPA